MPFEHGKGTTQEHRQRGRGRRAFWLLAAVGAVLLVWNVASAAEESTRHGQRLEQLRDEPASVTAEHRRELLDHRAPAESRR